MIQPYEVTWFDFSTFTFEARFPHWIIGRTQRKVSDSQHLTQYCITAAVMATSPQHATHLILEAYEDVDPAIEWCVVEEQPLGWSPFSEQLPRLSWMIWDQRPH